ncbi:unnamed protein product, partial [Larinioides sclopetarius]
FYYRTKPRTYDLKCLHRPLKTKTGIKWVKRLSHSACHRTIRSSLFVKERPKNELWL